VFNKIRIPVIPEAGRKLAHDPDALLDLAQQQPTAFGGDGSVHSVPIRLFSFVAWFLSRQKSYAMK